MVDKTLNIELNTIYQGNCIEVMKTFPDKCIDVVIADPPYNLRLRQELFKENGTKFNSALYNAYWDKLYENNYNQFTHDWLLECKRILKPKGTIWVFGTYHNIHIVGYYLLELGYKILNDIVWIKPDAPPNFYGVRFANKHENILWAINKYNQTAKFNYHAMKNINDGTQMSAEWVVGVCKPPERLTNEKGERLHPSQKPEKVIHRMILASTKIDDVILDPFFGTGTTGVVAKKLHRNWIGIEMDEKFISIAQERIDKTNRLYDLQAIYDVSNEMWLGRKVSFGTLVEEGIIQPGQKLFLAKDLNKFVYVRPDGTVVTPDGKVGTIHMLPRKLLKLDSTNGWKVWYYFNANNELVPIDELRKRYLEGEWGFE